jgi:hypothetical protein
MPRIGSTIMAMLTILVACTALARAQYAVPPASGIWQSGSPSYALSGKARDRLVSSLRRITGIERIVFGPDGRLDVGHVTAGHKGSSTARRILQDAIATGDILVLEDHSDSMMVNFGQIERLDYSNDATNQRARVWWIRLDFADFQRIAASPRVRASFDEGFTLLHELLHALGHHDTVKTDELGECETILNQVRHEVALPLRAEYFAMPVRTAARGVVAIRLRFLDGPDADRQHHRKDLHFALSIIAPSTSTSAIQRRGP